MANANSFGLIYGIETTWGELPSNPSGKVLRLTRSTLNNVIETQDSAEIRSDRQREDLANVSERAEGDIGFELSYGAIDDLLQTALLSTAWTSVNITGTDISATGSGFEAASTDLVAGGIRTGDWIKVAGFTGNTANNTFYQVTAVTATTITTATAPAAVDPAGESVTISSSSIRNGTTPTSLWVEGMFTDITTYSLFTGIRPSRLALNIPTGRIVSGDLSLLGKQGTLSGMTADSSPTEAPSNTVLNSSNNIMSVTRQGLSTTANLIESLTVNVDNNLRGRGAVGSRALTSIGEGSCDVSGELTTYFDNKDLYNAFRNAETSSLTLHFNDNSGNQIIVDMPRTQFSAGSIDIEGINTDIFARMQYVARRHPVYNYQIQISRFDA